MIEAIMIAIAIPVFFGTMWLEHRWLEKNPDHDAVGYEKKDTLASLAMGTGFLVISSIAKLAVVPLYLLVHKHRLFDIPTTVGSVIALVFLQDFCFYWMHRSHHAVRMLWAAHVNHHSSEHYNLSTALRQSWTEHLTAIPFFMPLVLLGFDPVVLFVVELGNLFYQYFVHTEAVRSMGWLESVMNTPSHHRVHHGSNPKYIDKNHAGIFIIWDRMFGTFQKEEERVTYGLTRNIKTFNPVVIAFHEWGTMIRDAKAAETARDAVGYILGPPGWKPEAKVDSGIVADAAE